MTVAQIITDTWPNTEQVLQTGEGSALGYAGAKLRAIDAAISDVWLEAGGTGDPPVAVVIDTYSLPVQEWVAYTALLRLLPFARDFYMQGKLSSTQSYQQAGTGTDTTYNKLQALGEIEEYLLAQIDRVKKAATVILVPAPVVTPGVLIPTFFTLAKGRRY